MAAQDERIAQVIALDPSWTQPIKVTQPLLAINSDSSESWEIVKQTFDKSSQEVNLNIVLSDTDRNFCTDEHTLLPYEYKYVFSENSLGPMARDIYELTNRLMLKWLKDCGYSITLGSHSLLTLDEEKSFVDFDEN